MRYGRIHEDMKYARKNNNKKLVLVIILSIILAMLVCFVIYMETDWAQEPSPTEGEAPTGTAPQMMEQESTEPEETMAVLPEETAAEDTPKDLMVTTPYCNLHYPGQWQDSVRVEMESTAYGCIVTFYGSVGDQEEKLFAVFFTESSDDSFPVGIITHGGTAMDVSVELFDIVPGSGLEEPDADELNAMQEGVNYLIDRLEENPVFSAVSQLSGSDIPEETKAPAQDLVVDTPYCNLYYPAQWKDAVRYEAERTDAGYIAVFYGTVNGKDAELFTVYFAETSEDSVPVGIYTAGDVAMDVSISMPELPENNDWCEADREIFYALQEKVNYLIDKLKEDTAFEPV